MFSMCFPDEVFDYGLLVDFGGGTDGVTDYYPKSVILHL